MSNDSLSLRATMGIIKWLVALQWWPPQGRYQGRHCSHHGHFKGLFSVQQQDFYTPKHQMQDRAKREQWFRLIIAGRIPSVVLASGGAGAVASNRQLLTTDAKQIHELLKQSPFSAPLPSGSRSGSSVVLQSGTVLPIKVHRIVETEKILNLVMAWVEKGTELKVDVPVVFKGGGCLPWVEERRFSSQDQDQFKIPLPIRKHTSKN
ncbi:unnamed protein product [Musa acuminata subsp. malaccensis]|uniref:(wild Malaysian banana) hypothetical protein n=1 Tax=Musa acuminata subsp. malaccensis TaxID=214687 RepID=A0A8D7AA21_MUSAM|nr:unnamed protein product [Musa acuminata subsp. malaccensis]